MKKNDDTIKTQEPSTGKLNSVRSTGKLNSVRRSGNNVLSPTASPSKTKKPQACPKNAKAKSKSLAKDALKPHSKPIHSFFNATTQTLVSSQRRASRERASPVLEEFETIRDGSDDDQLQPNISGVTYAKDSSTALALRKRKFTRTSSFETEPNLALPASQKFRKSVSGERIPSLSVFNEGKRPWTEQFAPIDLSELAVHKRKVADVRQWLESTMHGRRHKVLVLKGAAGAGKTTTINLLAKSLGLNIIEWKDSVTSDHASDQFTSASARFEEFMGRAGRSSGLALSTGSDLVTKAEEIQPEEDEATYRNQPQALLIEEYPNTFSKSSSVLQTFRATIARYLASPVPVDSPPTPIVMIISETLLSTTTAAADSFTAHRLLGPELTMHPYVNVIEFNPVAPTFLIKALETIVVKEARKSGRRKTPGPQVLKHLAEAGDIRSAVSSLEFLCLRGDDGDTWSSKVAFTKPKQNKAHAPLTKSEEESLKLISNRESTLGIFHAVGKVVYNKRMQPSETHELEQLPPWLAQYQRSKVPETDVSSLMDELGTDTSTFVSALHENYALSCVCSTSEETLDCLFRCAENISDADLLCLDRFSFGTRSFSGSATDSLRQDEMYFQVSTRGLLFNLPCPVHRDAPAGRKRGDAHRMFYPTSLKLWRRKEEIESNLDSLTSQMSYPEEGTRTVATTVGITQGVQSWKRNKPLTTESTAEDLATQRLQTEAKTEILIDRLPYILHIYESSNAHPSSQSMLERIRSVARISESVVANNDDDTVEEDALDPDVGTEQWSTDQPDNEPKTRRKPSQRIDSSKGKTMFEGGGLAIPVESRVEKLVLEDDDIVDD